MENSEQNLTPIVEISPPGEPAHVESLAVESLAVESLAVDSKGESQVTTIPRVGVEKVQKLERRLEALSKLSMDFLALLTASVVIATFGLFQNSVAVIIGAMIIAPLMRPLLGLSLALLTSDMLLLRRASITLLVGTTFGVCIAAILAVMLQQIELTSEILARTKPNLLDLGVAIFAGAIGAYCQTKDKLADSLAGVAIAVALVPPLSVVGIGLALNRTELWQGAALLYLTNLVGITISGALIFVVMGYAHLRRARRGLIFSSLALTLLIIPLALSMNEMLFENRLSSEIRQILKEKTHTFRDIRLREVEVKSFRKPLTVVATVLTDQQINPKQVRMVQQFLIEQLGTPLDFKLRVVPLTEISAKEDETVITTDSISGPAQEPIDRPVDQPLPQEIEDASRAPEQ